MQTGWLRLDGEWYYLAGNGYGEIAWIMGKTPKSIDNALQRIRTKIREQLEQYQK